MEPARTGNRDLTRIELSVLLIAILFVGAMIGIYVEKFVSWQNRREWRRRWGCSGICAATGTRDDAGST